MTTEPRRTGCFPWLLIVGLLMSLLCGLPVGLVLSWRSSQRRAFERELRAARDRGEPTTAAELEAYYELPPGAVDNTAIWLAASQEFTLREEAAERAALPILGERPTPDRGAAWPDVDLAKAYLARHQPVLEQLHASAQADGAARLPTDFSQGFDMLMENVQELRSAVRALQLEAFVHIHAEDAAGAARSIQTLLAAERIIGNYPVLIGQLVRYATHGVAIATLERALNQLDFNDEQLGAIGERLSQINFEPSMKSALLGERVMGLDFFEHPSRMGLGAAPLPIMPLRDADRAQFAKLARTYIAAAELPFPASYQQIRRIAAENEALVKSSTVARLQYPLSSMVGSSYQAAGEATARTEATRRLALTAVALGRFRARNGRWPAALTELIPDYLAELPQDPFTGKTLNYRQSESGYRVYSAGKNERDDGGLGDLAGDPDLVFQVEPAVKD